MNDAERDMHLRAGLHYGRRATCGEKIDYKSEGTAVKAAAAMTRKNHRAVEGYPCFWCAGWHVGREMTPEEREQFSAGA